MVKEIMDEIKAAERKAEENLEKARIGAKEMVDLEVKNCESSRQKALKEQEEMESEIMNQAKDDGAQYEKKVEDEATIDKEKIINLAREKEDGAIALVIQEIMK